MERKSWGRLSHMLQYGLRTPWRNNRCNTRTSGDLRVPSPQRKMRPSGQVRGVGTGEMRVCGGCLG